MVGWDTLWSTGLGARMMTLLVSMVPIVELRGAIPLGVAHGVPLPTAVCLSIVGNMMPVPVIMLFVRQVFQKLGRQKNFLASWVARLEERAGLKSQFVIDYELLGLIFLVAIPLPGTGAWTGALVASLLELRIRHALPAIFVGVVIAAGIITALTLTAWKGAL